MLPLAIATLLVIAAVIYVSFTLVERKGGTALVSPHPSPKATPKSSPSTKPKPKPKPVTSGLKKPMAGLIDEGGLPSSAFYSVIDGYVVDVSWASLQLSRGGPITSGNRIDKAIASVRQANASGAHLALKLRVYAGTKAPDWAKNIGGPPVLVRDPLSNVSGTIGRFWTPAFGQACSPADYRACRRRGRAGEVRARWLGIVREPQRHRPCRPPSHELQGRDYGRTSQ